jgi:hypothetical protein
MKKFMWRNGSEPDGRLEMTMDAYHSDLQGDKLHVAHRDPSVRAGLAFRSDDELFLVRTSS